MNDSQLLEKLRSGDHSAFRYLYKHYGKIENHVLKNSGTKDDARDLFQNALIVFYKKIREEDFELTSAIGTYLFSIVKNSWLKKITRNREISGFDDLDRQAERYDSGKMEPDFAEKEVVELESDKLDQTVGAYLQNLLKKIGDPCKSLIVFFHFDKLSWEEIADKLNYKTAHAARNQKYKCFLKIRKLIPDSDRERLFGMMQ